MTTQTVNNDHTYRTAKQHIDDVFIICLTSLQAIQKIMGRQQNVSMEVGAAASSLWLAISWLQRIYNKAHLEDSEEFNWDLDLSDDPLEALEQIIGLLDSAIDHLEKESFAKLHNSDHQVSWYFFRTMIHNVYTHVCEAQSMLMLESGYTEAEPPKAAAGGEA